MIDFILGIAVLSVVALFVWVFVFVLPARRQYKVDLRTVSVDGNHEEMHLLFYELLALDRRGLFVVFPDDDTRDRAQRLVDQYRAHISHKELP